MIDASGEPLEENIRITRQVVDAAHARGISVEAELGQLGGVEEHVQVDEKNAHLTDPAEAEVFVQRIGLRQPGRAPSAPATEPTSSAAHQGLHLDVAAEIQKRLPGFPLVMHGSSSVPQEEVRAHQRRRRRAQGRQGVDENEFARAVPLGVTKVNIDTDGRLVWTRVHREFFRDNPEKFDLRDPGKIFMAEYAKFIAHKNEKLGSAGTLEEVRAAVS